MLNPAWQPAEDQSERLIEISHHFLSDAASHLAVASSVPAVGTEPGSMRIPVLLATRDGAPGCHAPEYLLGALTRQLNLPHAAADPLQPARAEIGWNLQPVAVDTTLPDLRDEDLVLIMADAELGSTRDAYAQIKRLTRDRHPQVAVLYRSGEDLGAARRCYRRLAVGSIRFLNQTLINLGCLPPPGPHFAAALAHAAQVIQSRHPAREVAR